MLSGKRIAAEDSSCKTQSGVILSGNGTGKPALLRRVEYSKYVAESVCNTLELTGRTESQLQSNDNLCCVVLTFESEDKDTQCDYSWRSYLILSLLTVPSPKVTNFPQFKDRQHYSKVLINSFATNGHRHLRILFIESKVRNLCITQV